MFYNHDKKACGTMALTSGELSFPVQIEVLKEGVQVQESGKNPVYWDVYQYESVEGVSCVVYESFYEYLTSVASKHTKMLNDNAVFEVNRLLKSGEYGNARTRYQYKIHVVQSAENENLYTLSVSKRLIDNDLSSDMFVCAMLKDDVKNVIDMLGKLVKKEVSGKCFERALETCYTDLKLDTTNSINKNRRVYLEGYYKTTHAVADDYFKRTLAKKDVAGLFSAILASDATIARTSESVKLEKARKKANK